MGIFSFVCSCAGSFCRGVASLGSSLVSGIARGISSVVSAGVNLVSGIISKGGFLGTIAEGAKKLFSAATGLVVGPLGSTLGSIVGELLLLCAVTLIESLVRDTKAIDEDEEEEVKAEEVGYRVNEASKHEDWQPRENFACTSDYHNYLKQQIPEVDEEDIKANFLTYKVLGASLMLLCVEEQNKIDMPVDLVVELSRCRVSGSEILAIIDKFQKSGYDMQMLFDFMRGRLKGSQRVAVEKELEAAFTKANPEWTNDVVSERVASLRKASQDDVFMANLYQRELDELRKIPQERQSNQDVKAVWDKCRAE